MKKIFVYTQNTNSDRQTQVLDQYDITYFSDLEKLLYSLMNRNCEALIVNSINEKKYLRSYLNDHRFLPPIIVSDVDALNFVEIESELQKIQESEKKQIANRLQILIQETDQDVTSEILDMFTSKREEYLSMSTEYLKKSDIQAIKFLAHNLKSTSALNDCMT